METLFYIFNKITQPLKGKFLGKIPGLAPFYRLLYRITRPRGTVLINVQGIQLNVDTKDQGIVPHLLTNKGFEEDETALFKALVKPGMTVVDIGANFGYFTCLAASLVGKEGRVYAFEPEPSNYNLLLKNIDQNQFQNVTPLSKAVSSQVGEGNLFLDSSNFGAPSLVEGNVTSRKGCIEIETTTLDFFFSDPDKNPPDLIKIDAQGGEGLIIEGAKRVLQKRPLKLIMEFWPFGLWQMGYEPLLLFDQLIRLGFTIQLIGGKSPLTELTDHLSIEKNKKSREVFFNLFLEK
jgi:FkbM family methyltransferase